MWESHDGLKPTVVAGWDTSVEANYAAAIKEKLKNLSANLSVWNNDTFGSVRKEIKTLKKGVCEEMILSTFNSDEVGKAGISSILCELLKDSSLFHELGVRPFARPYFHQPPRMEITVR